MDFDAPNLDYTINWRDVLFGCAKDDDFEKFLDISTVVAELRSAKYKDILSVHDMQKKTLYMTNFANCKDSELKILNFMYQHDVDFNNTDADGRSLLYYMHLNKTPGMKKRLHDFIVKKSGILYTDEKLKLNM